jgi:iron complex transport system substrate-binding protein
MGRSAAGLAAVLGALVLTWTGTAAGHEPPCTVPEKIVTLAPSVTEVVFALGMGARVVGTCAQCDWPAAAARRPRVGTYLAPSVEAVLGIQPDVVFVVPSPGNREAVRALERAGVCVVVVQDRTLDDLWQSIRIAAAVLAVPERGEALVHRLQGKLAAVRRRVSLRPQRRVLLVVGHRPLVVAGRGTLQSELLAVAGGRNVAEDVGEAFPQIGLETVIARAPEVIVDAGMGTETGARAVFRGLDIVPAVAAGRIVSVAADGLFRAGPRIAEGAKALARAVHPEAFDSGGARR